jgi:hypothetical protein
LLEIQIEWVGYHIIWLRGLWQKLKAVVLDAGLLQVRGAVAQILKIQGPSDFLAAHGRI